MYEETTGAPIVAALVAFSAFGILCFIAGFSAAWVLL
jgi:hypothetical protein